jgi:hypothetical protein
MIYCAWSHAGWEHWLLVIEHRAKIAHVKPVFKEVELNRGSPMASERKRDTMLVILKSERCWSANQQATTHGALHYRFACGRQ